MTITKEIRFYADKLKCSVEARMEVFGESYEEAKIEVKKESVMGSRVWAILDEEMGN